MAFALVSRVGRWVLETGKIHGLARGARGAVQPGHAIPRVGEVAAKRWVCLLDRPDVADAALRV